MVAKEAPIQDVMKVVLNTAATELDEVMVVAYGTAKKSSFTGSAKAVNAEDIVAGSKESLDKALSGKMSGVRVTSNTGDPGAPGDINIRGVGSISAAKSPLYVVDGVPVKSDSDMAYYGKQSSLLSSLNPDDIESMTVLKMPQQLPCTALVQRMALSSLRPKPKEKRRTRTKVKLAMARSGWSNMTVKQYEDN